MATASITNADLVTQGRGSVVRRGPTPDSCVLALADSLADVTDLLGFRPSDVTAGSAGQVSSLTRSPTIVLEGVASDGDLIYLSETVSGAGSNVPSSEVTVLLGTAYHVYEQSGTWYAELIPNVKIFAPTGFITRWTVAGDAAARTITLPLVNTRFEGPLAYNCTVDWGDGSPTSTVTAYNDPDRIHTYAADGTYDVEIRGVCEGWSFTIASDRLKITAIVNWGSKSLFDGFAYLLAGFAGCTNLTSLGRGTIPASGSGIGVNGFNSTFTLCDIITIPVGLFKQHAAVTSDAYRACFNGCSALTSIPPDLFKQGTSASNNVFDGTFEDCISLTSIPTDLFRHNTAVSDLAFSSVFSGCTSLTSIPDDLFRYNTLAGDQSFNSVFSGCSSLVAIPVDLFRYNTLVSGSAFERAFADCASLVTVPADLFRYNTLVGALGFHSTFENCTSLATVPADLFRYNTVSTTEVFKATFSGCTKLQLNRNIFYADGEEATRFLNQSPNFSSCFDRASFTGTQGEAPDLWNCSYGTGTPVKTSCFGGGGNSLTSLSNYGDIPAAWK